MIGTADDEIAKLALECLKIKLETEKSESQALGELIGKALKALAEEWKEIKPHVLPPKPETTELPNVRKTETL